MRLARFFKVGGIITCLLASTSISSVAQVATTPFRHVVINEIFADPTPVQGLPNAEFLELYNPMAHPLQLKGFTIDGKTLPQHELAAGAYVILTTVSKVNLFKSYGEVIGLTGRWALTNTGEKLILKDPSGSVVDSVSYQDTWYKDASKKKGGYTLEQINSDGLCGSRIENWSASTDASGGTPGRRNAIHNMDRTPPSLTDFYALSRNAFRLVFSERMNERSLLGGAYTFHPSLSLTPGGVLPNAPNFQSVTLRTSAPLVGGKTYTVTVTGVADCSNHAIVSPAQRGFLYDDQPPVLKQVIIRSETALHLVFDEALDHEAAETESHYNIIGVGHPKTARLDGMPAHQCVLLTFTDQFTEGQAYRLSISGVSDRYNNVLAAPLERLFTWRQDIREVKVVGRNLLDVHFKTPVEQTAATQTANYSVSPEVGAALNAFVDPDDSRVVHLAFSQDFKKNKDYLLIVENMQTQANAPLSTPNVSFRYDRSPPRVTKVEVEPPRRLKVLFNEAVERPSAQWIENYQCNDMYPISATLKDPHTVVLAFEKEFEQEQAYELYVAGIQDLQRNAITRRVKYAFVYDEFPPTLDSIAVTSARSLRLFFNENIQPQSAQSPAHYTLGDGIGQPLEVRRGLEHKNIVHVTLRQDLPRKADIRLEIAQLADERGNALQAPIQKTFDFHVFYAGEVVVLNQDAIQLVFNQPVQAAGRTDPTHYLLDGQTPTAVAYSSDHIAVLHWAKAMKNRQTYELKLTGLFDQDHLPLGIHRYRIHMDARHKSSRMISDRTVELSFDVPLDADQVVDLRHFTVSPSLGACQVARINPDHPERLSLTFTRAFLPNQPYTISWKGLLNEYQNPLPDYFVSLMKDDKPPAPRQHRVVNAHQLWIQYTEPLNKKSAALPHHYRLTSAEGYMPYKVVYQEQDTSVLLTFPVSWEADKDYTLYIQQVKDLAGNALAGYDWSFRYVPPYAPRFGDLIITEVMADPTPAVGDLPEVEYVEIYNTSDETIALAGIKLVDERSEGTLSAGEMKGKSYALLTSATRVNAFSGINVVGVTGFPSLGNVGESLSLRSDQTLLFSMQYALDWYKDTQKQNGGWALEMVDPQNPCGEKENWTASVDPSGGTPGRVNSVQASNPDLSSPKVVKGWALSPEVLRIDFSEKIHPDAKPDVTITPAIPVRNATWSTSDYRTLTFNLAAPLSAGVLYQVRLSAIRDCLGHVISSDGNATQVTLPQAAAPHDILINEVLFNPRPGGTRFVELYNHSTKTIDLKGWRLGNRSTALATITAAHRLLSPEAYLVISKSPAVLQKEYPQGDVAAYFEMRDFPALSDEQDSIILTNAPGLVIDRMAYHEDRHLIFLPDKEGVSLERISWEASGQDLGTWQSAASATGWATPGKINSQFRKTPQSADRLFITPRVFTPDHSGTNDYTTIRYRFAQPVGSAYVRVYSARGELVKTLARGDTLPAEGAWVWDGSTDRRDKAAIGYYVVLFEAYSSAGDKISLKKTVAVGSDIR